MSDDETCQKPTMSNQTVQSPTNLQAQDDGAVNLSCQNKRNSSNHKSTDIKTEIVIKKEATDDSLENFHEVLGGRNNDEDNDDTGATVTSTSTTTISIKSTMQEANELEADFKRQFEAFRSLASFGHNLGIQILLENLEEIIRRKRESLNAAEEDRINPADFCEIRVEEQQSPRSSSSSVQTIVGTASSTRIANLIPQTAFRKRLWSPPPSSSPRKRGRLPNIEAAAAASSSFFPTTTTTTTPSKIPSMPQDLSKFCQESPSSSSSTSSSKENFRVTEVCIRLHDCDRTDIPYQNEWPKRPQIIQEKNLRGQVSFSFPNFVQIHTKLVKYAGDNVDKISVHIWNSNIFHPELLNFFSLHGHLITSLLIGQRKDAYFSCYIQIPGNLLFNLIQDYLPNLQTLTLTSGLSVTWDFVQNFSAGGPLGGQQTFCWPKVNTLSIFDPHGHPEYWSSVSVGPPLISNILKSAPNLQTIYNLPLNCLSKFLLSSQKVGAIKSLLYGLEKPENSPHHFESCWKGLQDLSQLGGPLALEKFQITLLFSPQDLQFIQVHQTLLEIRKTWSEIFSKIIRKSVDTLRKVEIVGPLDIIDFVEFPILRRLSCLKLTVLTLKSVKSEVLEGRVFPVGFDLGSKFPNLTKLVISVRDKKAWNLDNLFEKLFPPDTFTSLHSVRHLRLETDEICVANLGGLLPNLEILSLALCSWNVGKILPKCFKAWPKLRQIRIILGIEWDIAPHPLDAAFTGIPNEKCQLLDLAWRTGLGAAEDGEEKIDPQVETWVKSQASIGSMRDLQILKFIFKVAAQVPARSQTGLNWLEQPDRVSPLLSQVTNLYGFRLVPHLKVQVAFHESLFPGLIPVIKDYLLKPVHSSLLFVE